MTVRTALPLSALVGLSLVAASCKAPEALPEKHPIPVKVQALEGQHLSGPTRYSGTLEPKSRVDLAFRVSGYVEALGQVQGEGGPRALDKGDFVKKGTVLARVRATDYAQKVKTADAQLSEARAQRVLAQEDLGRARRLFEGKAITKAELDAQVARFESASAQVDAALARTGEAGVSLGDTVLKAPMDGIVLSRSVEIGKLVAPGEPALTIADVRTVKAVFGAPQFLVEKLAVGSPVAVYVGAESEAKSPEKLLEARVSRIAPAADNNGRVFSVEAELANDSGALRPGTVVSVRIADDTGAGNLVVPLASVIRSPKNSQGFSVFVLGGQADRARAELRDVRLGDVVGNGVTVAQGLNRNDRVVTVGATLLRDGSDAVVIR